MIPKHYLDQPTKKISVQVGTGYQNIGTVGIPTLMDKKKDIKYKKTRVCSVSSFSKRIPHYRYDTSSVTPTKFIKLRKRHDF